MAIVYFHQNASWSEEKDDELSTEETRKFSHDQVPL
jgi:hypothetical protein